MVKVEDNLLSVANCLFKNRQDWKYVSEEMKIKYFFIINRLLSKKYPEVSQLLNLKTINQVVGMDLIYKFFEGKPYPKWFWSKGVTPNDSIISQNDYIFLKKRLELKDQELDFLIKNHFDEVNEELKYFKNLDKQ